jgi:hypothetical protein
MIVYLNFVGRRMGIFRNGMFWSLYVLCVFVTFLFIILLFLSFLKVRRVLIFMMVMSGLLLFWTR